MRWEAMLPWLDGGGRVVNPDLGSCEVRMVDGVPRWEDGYPYGGSAVNESDMQSEKWEVVGALPPEQPVGVWAIVDVDGPGEPYAGQVTRVEMFGWQFLEVTRPAFEHPSVNGVFYLPYTERVPAHRILSMRLVTMDEVLEQCRRTANMCIVTGPTERRE